MRLARALVPCLLLAPLLAAADITGDLKQWHKVTLTFTGPETSESATPNPFLDYRLNVTFTHSSGQPSYVVPAYFAADGRAAETSATSGNRWRVHFAPDKTGVWNYRVSFVQGAQAAVEENAPAKPLAPLNGESGQIRIAPSTARAPDFRARGRLAYVGEHYLKFLGSGEYFLKAGVDSPETLLAYEDFDGASTRKTPLKKYTPHLKDWRPGDPSWRNGKGKGLIGALNYLSGKGLNSISFLTYNAGGDGDNVWPYVTPDDKLRLDCSKLDQWQTVFDHAQVKGLYLHFKLQETENDDDRIGQNSTSGKVPAALDGGRLGPERKLYLRELIARFGYELALNWNLGEENTQSPDEQRAMAKFIRDTDPYKHHIVVHTYPNWQDRVYAQLTGEQSVLTGASLQMDWNRVHERTLQWLRASAQSGRKWVVANDEQGSAAQGVPPDPGYQGFNGVDKSGKPVHTLHDIRKKTLWAHFLAGGAGVEYYFGYQLPENDLALEDFRSRDQSYDYCRYALAFFRDNKIPFWRMTSADDLTAAKDDYVFAEPGKRYLVYLPNGGSTDLDLSAAKGTFDVAWFNPRKGGPLRKAAAVQGASKVPLRPPAEPTEDWLAVVTLRP